MASSVYECLCILDSNKYAQDPGGVSGQVPGLVSKLGGEVLVSRLWNEQKLMYPIGHHKKGTYWITYFKMDTLQLKELNREMRINENIVRYLTLKIPDKVAGPLIDHAKGIAKPRPAAEATVGTPERAAVALGDEVEAEE